MFIVYMQTLFNMYRGNGSLALAIVCFSCALAKGMTQMDMMTDSKPSKCTHERAFDMYGASCAGLRLQQIPNLKSSIEILDFSENKLHQLHRDTFAGYTSIRFLYLADNQIYQIDDGAFEPLSYLQTLDLSNNVILSLSESIFQLPSLRQLYLRGNPLHMLSNNLPLQISVKAPLELLDISGCNLQALPTWGIMPYLTHYNISHNPLQKLEAEHFAPMCKLVKVDITKSIDITPACDLKPAILWLQIRNVNFQLDDYKKLNSKEFNDCPMPSFEAPNSTHQRCKAIYLEYQSLKLSRRTWLTVTGGLAGFLVGFMLLLYLMHRHNVARTKTKAEKMKKAIPTDNSDMHATVPILAASETNEVQRI